MDADAAAHSVNARIAQLGRAAGDEWRFDFLCECGCFGKVQLTVAEYLAAGVALLPGHGQPELAVAL
jgi:hypothetical protein